MSDAPDFVAAGATHKAERKAALMEALSRSPDRDDHGSDARRRLEELLDEAELAAVDEHVLATVTAAREAQAEPTPFFDALGTARAAQKRTLIDAVRGREPDPDPSTLSAGGSFDGGAREGLPAKPESHEAFLSRLLAAGLADVGRHF